MSSTTSAAAASACLSCGHQNAPEVKFCGECGHSLFEPCVGCGQSVLLSQKFCGSCGANLQETRDSKTAEFQKYLAEGIELGKAFKFEQSLSMLKRVAEQTDHRFSDLAKQASAAIKTNTEFRSRTTASPEQAIVMAVQAFERGERREVIRLLEIVPAALMTPEATEMLSQSRLHFELIAARQSELQEALSRKDWTFAGQNIDALIELVPDNEKYKKLAQQIADKLLNSASRRFGRQDYFGAKQQLHAIPKCCRNGRFMEAERNVQNLEWLSQQFAREAFVTGTLGRLAARFAKEFPHDEQASRLFQEMSAAHKQPPDEPRLRHASWHGSKKSWIGPKAGLLAFPQAIELQQRELLAKHPGRFSVAIGLALQGLGKAWIEEQFCPKKGLFSKLGKRKTDCWGIDVGSAGIRAVKLVQPKVAKGEDQRIELVESYLLDFDSPSCRPGENDQGSKATVDALKRMAEELEFGDDPVWVNLPAFSLVSRFLRLPPIKDKQADKLMAQEAQQRIPLAIDELELIQWIAELGGDDDWIHGRPAAISAAKKVDVEKRLALFGVADIKVSGMQAEPIALVNLLRFEFEELWSGDSEHQSDEGEMEDAESEQTGSCNQAVALIDSGAATTTLVIVSDEAYWFYTIDSEGEDLTALLSRVTKMVRSEAEKLKFNPAAIEHHAIAWEPVENKLLELRARLQQMLTDGKKQNGRFNIQQCWYVGGATATHGWIRCVMLSAPAE